MIHETKKSKVQRDRSMLFSGAGVIRRRFQQKIAYGGIFPKVQPPSHVSGSVRNKLGKQEPNFLARIFAEQGGALLLLLLI